MSSPLISVVVPIYNVAPYLERCLDSIVSQTYTNLEILLVDDGSTDHSGAIADAYAGKDSRVTVIHQKNGGLSIARNTGIDAARGEYLLFIDSDDYIAPNMCECLLIRSIEADSDITVGGFYRVSSRGSSESAPPSLCVISKADIILQYFKNKPAYLVIVWNKLYKASLFHSPTSLRFAPHMLEEDEIFSYRILYRASKIAMVNQPLYYYVQREGSIMHDGNELKHLLVWPKIIREYYRWAEKDAPDMMPLIEWVGIHSFNHLVWRCVCSPFLSQMLPALTDLEKDILSRTHAVSSNPYMDLRTKKLYWQIKFHLLIPIKQMELLLGKKKI